MLCITLILTCLTSSVTPHNILYTAYQKPYTSIFSEEQVIFTTNHNITKLLVPADGISYIQHSDIPSIFFTVHDKNLEGEHCIYVLEGLAAYEILEGGRDSTSDYGSDKAIYFGAKDGVYVYDAASLSAKKFGPFRDDIVQIQKANGSDIIFYLTTQNRIYKLEKHGMVRTKITSIICALEFVLDTSNNIYYLACEDKLPRVVTPNGDLISFFSSVTGDFSDVKLLRPAFIMDSCVPFFADDVLYIMYSNGTSEKKDFHIKEKPSAFSIDSMLYVVAAINGKIYEFNVLEMLLKSMFKVPSHWSINLKNIIMSVIDSKDSM
ncbi:uncharacterized protein LOC123703703 [Colias croceus]|uniref:uncharacterized protein LOC123703703 n=1 Tax=Colias crocea TaxID=72248 RepID=UPI001E27AFE8|nr:uncharacterized protein LOC123703703 [Colias croceus]